MLTILPIAPVLGSTGHPSLGVTNTYATQPTTYTTSASYVNVTAGSAAATTDLGVSGFLAIDFGTGCTAGGCSNTIFSGSVFSLYLSTNGFSSTTGDLLYAGGPTDKSSFLVTSLEAGWTAVPETNGTFHIGVVNGHGVLEGPIPAKISSNYKYIKIFDGSATSVAVSAQVIDIQPGLTLTPTSGPAGTTVTAFGGGFPSNTLIELTVLYTFYPWSGGTPTVLTGNWVTGVNTGSGYFGSTAPMFDSKQAYNPDSGLQPISHINIIAKYQASPHNTLASATFNENTRVFTGVKSYDSGGRALDFTNLPPGPYGNDTSAAGPNLAQPISAKVLGTINIAGNHSLVNSPVTFWIGTTQVGSSTTNGVGYFNATITIPILPKGTTVLEVINNGVTYEFNINILPTLVLTPSSGPVGTLVTVQAYGFPANTEWFVYWHEHSAGDATWYQIAHGTTGATGTFNVTVAFVVPKSYGGSHLISASSTNVTTSSPNSPGITEASATSTVTTSAITVTTTTTTTEPTTTITRSTTITQSTTQTETTTQPTTKTVTTTTTSLSTSASTFTYVVLGAIIILILVVAALAVWVLRGRRP